MAIYIIEIPHQRPASCWAATTEGDVIDTVCATMIRQHSGDELPDTFDQAINYLSSDLSRLIVLRSDDEARALYEEGIGGHQGGRAWDELKKRLLAEGAIDEDADADADSD
jgi:hypothetical protein